MLPHAVMAVDEGLSKCLLCTLSARKLGFICEENTSLTCQTPSNVSVGPLKLVTTTNWFMAVDIPAVNMSRRHHHHL